jgi:hypothetical protein
MDNIHVDLVEVKNKRLRLKLTNPTPFAIKVKIYSESSVLVRQTPFDIHSENIQIFRLEPNESKEILL